jgi:Protein of unknown function (DUF4054)
MSINPTILVTDFPEFSNATQYPVSEMNFWINIAVQSLNPQFWPQTAGPGVQANGSFTFINNPIANDTINLNGTIITFVTGTPGANQVQIGPSIAVTLANLLAVLSLSTDQNIVLFSYLSNATQLLLTAVAYGVQGNVLTIVSGNPTDITASGPTLVGGVAGRSYIDYGTELFVAHNLVLSRQAQKSAVRNAPPGVTRGPIASEGVGGASVSYSNQLGLDPDDGHWNLTSYGVRFVEMLKLVGALPVQVGIGRTPPLVGTAWPGPPFGWTVIGGPI